MADGPHKAAIGLGSNLGDRVANIQNAVAALDGMDDITVIAASALLETEPVGPPGQGRYLNGAVTLWTSLSPRALLDACMEIERRAGRDRRRSQRWGPRTLDLDLLLFEDLQIDDPGLSVPHPRLHERYFVLAPLAEVAGSWCHPTLGVTIESLLVTVTPTPVE